MGVDLGPFWETQNPTFSHFGVIFGELFFKWHFGCFLGGFLDGFGSVFGVVFHDIWRRRTELRQDAGMSFRLIIYSV